MTNTRSTLSIIVAVLFIAIVIIAGVKYGIKGSYTRDSITPIACTLEGKICPDGSVVGRSGPHCDFAACPTATSTPDLTLNQIGAHFIFPVEEWPPAVTSQTGTFSCTNSGTAEGQAGKTENRTINFAQYCVHSQSEGAAGTIYTTYTYTTARSGKLLSTTFTLGAPHCENFDESDFSACKNERQTFDLDTMIDGIMRK